MITIPGNINSQNPRNVVLWTRVAQYLEDGKIKFIPYNNLFERLESVNILNIEVLSYK